MDNVICPSCGSEIQLHEDMPFGYCNICGDKISYADATSLKLKQELLASKERLNALKPETLYTIAKQTEDDYKIEFMKTAAEKGYIPANLYMGIECYNSEDWINGEKYLKTAADGNSNDALALLTVLQYRKSSNSNKKDLLNTLKKSCGGKFENMDVYELCKTYINIIESEIAKEKRKSLSSYSDSYPGGYYSQATIFDPYKPYFESRAELEKILSNPGISNYEKQKAVTAHNGWHSDAVSYISGTTYDMGPYGGGYDGSCSGSSGSDFSGGCM